MQKDIEIIDKNYDKCLIFCHGLGDNGSSFYFLANEVKRKIKNIKIILPNAKINKVTANKNKEMPSWFDINEIPIENSQFNYKLEDSINYINNIIDYEISNGIKSTNIILAGFSQGASLVLATGFNYCKKLGGIGIFSGWISSINRNYNFVNIPIFLSHGDKDDIVLYCNYLNLINEFKKLNINNLTLKSYKNMNHSISYRSINDFIDWLCLIF